MLVQSIKTDFRVQNKAVDLNKQVKSPPSFSNNGLPLNKNIDAKFLMQNLAAPSFGKSYPLGFEETIDKNYFQLSGGKPDNTQLLAARSLFKGDSTVCIAPTGTGKTAIANYAITKNLEEGKKTYYTTPLKALSNDKYREFCKIYGEDNVGLLTGDIKLNHGAPVLIMTTEIFRNMALANYARSDKNKFKDVKTVIFDEAHYINEDERGKIWEESIMFMPKNTQVLLLSATVGNAKEFAGWVGDTTAKKTTLVESAPKNRHVPLVYYVYDSSKGSNNDAAFRELLNGEVNTKKLEGDFHNSALSERQARALEILKNKKQDFSSAHIVRLLAKKGGKFPMKKAEFSAYIQEEFKLKPLEAQEATQLLLDSDTKRINKDALKNTYDENVSKNDYSQLVFDLQRKNLLPAIIFKFSRKGCNDAAKELINKGVDLTSDDEKKEIEKVIKSYKDRGIYLGESFICKDDKKSKSESQILKGIGVHHAGIMPGHKKLVEELFARKLLKVVLATSTLSAGINMPARSTVITDVYHPTKSKDGERAEYLERVPLEANEFHQMSGRAGRRGVDTIGNVVLYNLKSEDMDIAKGLVLQKADNLESKYRPSAGFLVTYYLKNETDDNLDEFLDKTFAAYQNKTDDGTSKITLKEEYEKLREMLLESGYLEKTNEGFVTTLKGEMLSKAHGYNELTLTEMIINKDLARIEKEELIAFAASLSSTSAFVEDEVEDLVIDLLSEKCVNNAQANLLDVLGSSEKYNEKNSYAKELAGVPVENSNTDILSAYIAYGFASSLSQGEDSIKAFRNILSDPNAKKGEKAFKEFAYHPFGKVFEGNLYATLTQSIDVLKQIINICEFALEKDELANDHGYYKKLQKTAQEAVGHIKQPPVYDSLSVG